MLEILGFVVLVALVVIVFWLARVFYVLQKGLNEIISGLNSLDQRLANLEARPGERKRHDAGTGA